MAKENSYNFKQVTPSTTWVVNHNLGRRVVLDCFVTIGGVAQTILPFSIEHTSDNVSTVTFTTAYSGSARCI